MKKTLLTLVFILLALSSANAQFFNKSDVEIYKNKVEDQAIDLMKDHMDLHEDQAQIFWPLYKAYRADVDSLMNEELGILEEYLMNYYMLSERRATKLMGDILRYKREKIDLKEQYVKIMVKVLPAQIVARFFQIDTRINLMIQTQTTSKIPLVRDLDKK